LKPCTRVTTTTSCLKSSHSVALDKVKLHLPQIERPRPAGQILWPVVYLSALQEKLIDPESLLPDERKMYRQAGSHWHKVARRAATPIQNVSSVSVPLVLPLAAIRPLDVTQLQGFDGVCAQVCWLCMCLYARRKHCRIDCHTRTCLRQHLGEACAASFLLALAAQSVCTETFHIK
jgi:hypothetical protein